MTLLTVKEVSEKLRVHHSTVRRWIESNSLPAVELPRRGKKRIYRIHSETINALIQIKTMIPGD